jgi:glycosyltransferase involved in cell wall biosynthesis/O-antigen ligase
MSPLQAYWSPARTFASRPRPAPPRPGPRYVIDKVRGSSLDALTYCVLWCFVFSVPWEKTVMIPGLGSISRLIGLSVVVAGAMAIVARGWLRRLSVAHWCMVGFATWASLSYFWTVSTEATVDRAFTEVQLVIIGVLMWQFCTTQEAGERLVEAYVYGTLVVCASTLYRFAMNEHTYYQRYAAEGFDPNDLSLALAVSVPLSYFLFLRRRGWTIVWIVQIAAALLACLLAASRMGAVVSVLAFSIVLVTLDRLRTNQRIALGAGLTLIIVACLNLVPETSWNRLSSIMTEMRFGTLDNRTPIWAAGLEEFTKKPLAGVGAGAFGQAVDPLGLLVAHNTFISVLTELGSVGLLIFLAILGSLTVAVFQMESLSRRTWLVVLTVWAVGASTLTFEHRKPTWMLFALILQTMGRSRTKLPDMLRNPVPSPGGILRGQSFSPYATSFSKAISSARARSGLRTIRIAQLITGAASIGGAQTHVRDLIFELRSYGDQCTVLVGPPDGAFCKHLRENGVDVRIIPSLRKPLVFWQDVRALVEIINELRRLKPDVVAVHTAKAGFLGRLSAALLGIPCVFTPHGCSVIDRKTCKTRPLFLMLERVAGHLGDKVITVSKKESELVLSSGVVAKRKLVTIHNGIPDTTLLADPSRTPAKITMIARFDPPKDHETLLRALAELKTLPWSLQLAGSGALLDDTKRLASDLQIADRIEFLGECLDIPRLLSESQIFVLSSRLEAFPISILEAMRAGLPIIASAVGGIPEAVIDGRTGFLVRPLDQHALAERLNRCLSDSSLRVLLGHNARRRYLTGFSVESMGRKTLEAYRDAMSRRSILPLRFTLSRFVPHRLPRQIAFTR